MYAVAGPRSCSTARAGGAGFTVVEILVVVVVIALLIAISIPALAAARRASQAAGSLSNLRSLGQTFALYHDTYGAYPYGRSGWAVPPETGSYILYGFGIWAIRDSWPVLMHDLAPWREHARTWVSPGAEEPDRFASTWSSRLRTFTTDLVSYQYSTSFVGDPRLWDGRTEATDSFVRAQTGAAVQFPSSKAMAFDAERPYLDHTHARDEPRPVLLADGSGRLARDSAAAMPVPNPLSSREPHVYHDTPGGVSGRDFE